jgi:hypothetical protein
MQRTKLVALRRVSPLIPRSVRRHSERTEIRTWAWIGTPETGQRLGHEAEFERLFHALQKKKSWWRKRKEERFFAISDTAFETLNTPRVGFDAAADAWALEIYRSEPREVPEQAWLEKLHGFYVLDLVTPCDGLPRYSNGSPGGYVERYSFRAQFLLDCEYIISTPLLEAGYSSMLTPQLRAHGEALMRKFEVFVTERGLDPCNLDTDDPESPLFHADVVGAAGRWCLFWADRGHVLDSYW